MSASTFVHWLDAEPTGTRQVNADGSVKFTCVECGVAVFCAVDDGFEFPVCLECRWFGEHPQMQRETGR